MTKAPERIWVEDCSGEWLDDTGAWGSDKENDWDVEYVRADLVPQWQPIETAPKDEGILVYIPNYAGDVQAAIWDSQGEKWRVYGCSSISFPFDGEYYPTHWAHLPDPKQNLPSQYSPEVSNAPHP